MFVEFIGAAGAGKSFLSERVIERLRASGLPAQDFEQIKVDKGSPRAVRHIIRAAWLCARMRPKTLSLIRYTWLSIASYSVRRELCRDRQGIHVTSEGLFHHIITFQRNSRSLGMTQIAFLLFRSIQPPDVVVVVKAGVKTVYSRRSNRKRTKDVFSLQSVGEDVAIVEQAISTIRDVKQTFSPAMLVLRINAEEDGGESATMDIVRAIQDLSSGNSPPPEGSETA